MKMKSEAKFIHLCEKLVQTLLILLLTILFLLVLLLLTIPILGILAYRKILSLLHHMRMNDSTSKILTSGATILATDDVAHDPNLNVVITLTFNGQIRVQDLRQAFQEKILDLKDKRGLPLYPELEQYYKQSAGFLFWTKDEQFRLENHIRMYDYADLSFNRTRTSTTTGTGKTNGKTSASSSSFITQKDICRIKPELMAKGWPEGKSPWEFLVIPNYVENPGEFDYEYENCRVNTNDGSRSSDQDSLPDSDSDREENPLDIYSGGTMLIFRFHHGLADGVGVFRMLWARLAGNCCEIIGEIPAPLQEKTVRMNNGFKNSDRGNALNILYYLSLPFRIHFEYVKQLVESNDQNVWKIPEDQLLSSRVQSAVSEKIPLELVKGIRERGGVSFSAVILGAVAGAMRKSMRDSGVQIPTEMHALLPIPSRMDHGGKLRNHLTYIYPKIPVDIADCGTRLLECEANLKELKQSSVPLMNRLMHKLAGCFPTSLVKGLQKNVMATVLLSNFPGPSSKTFLLGQQMTDMTFATSCHGNNGIRISILSYNSSIRLSVEVNEALPHQSGCLAQQIVANIETELKNLKNCDSPQQTV